MSSSALRFPSDRPPITERHFAPDELATAWNVSVQTIRNIFRDEPGVLKIGQRGSRLKRCYITMRIPQQVVERVHRRLSE